MSKRWTQRPPGSTWGDWGDDDELGRINLLTPEKVLEGVRVVEAGISFCLSLPLDYPGGTALNQRRYPPVIAPTEDMEGNPDTFYNIAMSSMDKFGDPKYVDVWADDVVTLSLQYSTQWDSLAHVGAEFDADGDGVDEAVYYTLEIFPAKKKVERRTDQSSGVVDPRMMIPLQYPLVSGDKHAARSANTALMEVNGETDTLLTISHFENGLQGKDQEFGSRVEEDAEYARMILDFSSIPDAKTLVQQQSAWLTRDGKDQALQIVPLGESIYMVSYEDAKAGDYLGMSLTIVR